TPFTLYGHFTCNPVGWPLAEAQARALDHLSDGEEAGAEHALWTGDLGSVPNLAGANMPAGSTVVLAGGTAMLPGAALALLEDFNAANYGSLGVIHLTRGAALQAAGLQLLTTSGGRLVTAIGTPVVAGAGYDGSGPEGSPAPGAGESWGYVSPALFGYRGDVFYPDSAAGGTFDRAHNVLTTLAERPYLIGFDPCGVGAVKIKTA
ncbi:MAG TPA: hypothetical protein VGF32_02525, partial [Streptosporangiaceae bacterium]